MTNVLIQVGYDLAELQDNGEWITDNDALQRRLAEYTTAALPMIPYKIFHPDSRVRLALWVCSELNGRLIEIPEQDLPDGAIG